jgi:hypothetical protein
MKIFIEKSNESMATGRWVQTGRRRFERTAIGTAIARFVKRRAGWTPVRVELFETGGLAPRDNWPMMDGEFVAW